MLLSVIIPAYNCEKSIERCVASVSNQTYTNLEIIVINDGSKDNTHSICEELAAKDSRIVYVNQENSGVSHTRNKGISLAKGDYITFVDSDDYIESDMYEKMLDSIIKHSTDICVCGYNTVTESTVSKHSLPFEADTYDKSKIINDYIPLLIGSNGQRSLIGSCWVCIYNAQLIKNIAFRDYIKLQEDTIFNIEAFLQADSISFVKEELYNYCYYIESVTNKFIPNAFEQIELLEKIFAEYIGLLAKSGVDCSVNFNNTIIKWSLYLVNNYFSTSSPLTRKEKSEFFQKLMEKDNFKKSFRLSNLRSIKHKVLFILLRLRMYGLISLLKG